MSEDALLQGFLERVLRKYFRERPTKHSIEYAYRKLHDKARNARTEGQLRVIGFMNKRIYDHVPEGSKYRELAWQKNLEIDRLVREISEALRTEVQTSLGGRIGTPNFGIEARREKRRKVRFI